MEIGQNLQGINVFLDISKTEYFSTKTIGVGSVTIFSTEAKDISHPHLHNYQARLNRH